MSERYDYMTAVTSDILEYLADDENRFAQYWADDPEDRADLAELAEILQDELWTVDSVTGNASGSYTFNAWQAEEYLCHNLDLLGLALEEFGCDPGYIIEKGPEACDVTIRCYLLPACIAIALAEIRQHLAGVGK